MTDKMPGDRTLIIDAEQNLVLVQRNKLLFFLSKCHEKTVGYSDNSWRCSVCYAEAAKLARVSYLPYLYITRENFQTGVAYWINKWTGHTVSVDVKW